MNEIKIIKYTAAPWLIDACIHGVSPDSRVLL